jgi:hypothetical protein
VLVEVYGGPYDGAEVTCSVPGDFVYTDGRKSFREPGRGRVLARKWNTPNRGRILMYAESAYVRCPGCGSFHVRILSRMCSWCGAELPNARVPR